MSDDQWYDNDDLDDDDDDVDDDDDDVDDVDDVVDEYDGDQSRGPRALLSLSRRPKKLCNLMTMLMTMVLVDYMCVGSIRKAS